MTPARCCAARASSVQSRSWPPRRRRCSPREDVLPQALLGGILLDLAQQLHRADGLDGRDLADDLAHLVALEVADEVQRAAVIGVLGEAWRSSPAARFSPRTSIPAAMASLAGGGVVHLARADEGDVRAGAPALAGGGVDLAADGCNIFSDRHGLKTSFHSVFIQMPGALLDDLAGSMSLAVTDDLGSPARRMAEPSALFDARTSVYPSP